MNQFERVNIIQAANDVPDLPECHYAHSSNDKGKATHEREGALLRLALQVICESAMLHPDTNEYNGLAAAKHTEKRNDMAMVQELPYNNFLAPFLCPEDVSIVTSELFTRAYPFKLLHFIFVASKLLQCNDSMRISALPYIRKWRDKLGRAFVFREALSHVVYGRHLISMAAKGT
jgi:hypothetical protein